jgi:iron complex transport system substrate-binding protein
MRQKPQVPWIIILVAITTGCARQEETRKGDTRIVSLAPNMTEIVCAIGAGDLLVGRTSACNYPPQVVSKVPVVADFGAPVFESLIKARPTLVLEVDLQNEIISRRLDELGFKRLRVPCRTLSDIPVAIKSVGIMLHRESDANTLADSLNASIEELRRGTPRTNRPKVFVEIWNNPLMTAGSKSFISELITIAGGENLGDRIARQYFEVASEWVISHNPDVIICLTKTGWRSARNLVMKRPGWQQIQAVRSGRVYDNLNNDVVSRPGPRVVEAINELRERIAK